VRTWGRVALGVILTAALTLVGRWAWSRRRAD
jgi:hypothetical protein